MNRELKKVKKWLDANRLALNIDKTNFVTFHSHRTKLPEPVIIRFCRKKILENCVKFWVSCWIATLAGSAILINCLKSFLQGGHKPGKHGKPGKLREFEKLSKSQGKLREI